MATLASGKLSEMFEDFLKSVTDRSGNQVYRTRISQMIANEGKSLTVDFGELLKYNGDLANRLLLEPDSSLGSFKVAAFETMRSENALYADRVKRDLTVRIRGISDLVPLRKVDTSYLDRMMAVSGMVVRTSELRPLMTSAAWVCPSGHLTYQDQDEMALKRPPRCELCGEMRNFELDRKHSRFIDFQILRVQELPEELPPGQLPQFFDVNAEGDIVNLARPGDRVVLTGIVRAVQDYSPGQVRTRLFKSQIDCNHVEVRGKEPEQVSITKEDEALIRSIAESPDAYEKLVLSIAPVILGHLAEKEAILLLLAGGGATHLPDGTKLRGDINCLFVGDPGTGKSELLKFASQVAPRGLYASGRGTSLDFAEPIVVRKAGTVQVTKIGELVDANYVPGSSGAFVPVSGVECLSYDPLRGKIEWKPVTFVYRHRNEKLLVKLKLQTGREITVTDDHSVFTIRNGRLTTIRTMDLHQGDYVAIPGRLPPSHDGSSPGPLFPKELLTDRHLARLLGYYVAEGYLHEGKKGNESYRIHFELNRNEKDIIDTIRECCLALFGKGIVAKNKKYSNGVTVSISSKKAFVLFRDVLAVSRGARFKRVPAVVFNMPQELQVEFLRAYLEGDRGVTSSPYLISDLLYLVGVSLQKLGKFSTSKPNTGRIGSRVFRGGPSYRLKAPHPYRMGREIKCLGPPLEEVLPPFEAILDSAKHGLSLITSNGYRRLTPLVLGRLMRGKRLKRFALLSALELKGELTTTQLARGSGMGRRSVRQILVRSSRSGLVQLALNDGVLHASLTPRGRDAVSGVEEIRTIANSDLQFALVRSVKGVKSTSPYVYDLSVKGTENFIAGFGGVLCHNTAAGLSAAVIREKNVLMLEAGVVVLADLGIACLHPRSRVIYDNRITSIHDLATQARFVHVGTKTGGQDIGLISGRLPSFDTSDFRMKVNRATKIRRRLHRGPLISITLRSGNRLKVTDDHMLLDGDTLEWRPAGKFARGDFLVAPLKLPAPTYEEVYLWDILPDSCVVSLDSRQKGRLRILIDERFGTLISAGRQMGLPRIQEYYRSRLQPTLKELKGITKFLGIEEEWKRQVYTYDNSPMRTATLTPQLAYLCGFVQGDASVKISKRRASIVVTQSPRHQAYIDRFREYWEELFGPLSFRRRVSECKLHGGNSLGERIDWSVSRRVFGHVYEFLTRKHFENILALPDEVLRGLIAGLTDADGCIGKKNCEKKGRSYETWNVTYEISADDDTNLNFLLALKRFGVVGTYSGVKKGVGIVVVSSRSDVIQLQEELKEFSVKMLKMPSARKHDVSGISEKLPSKLVQKLFEEAFDGKRTTDFGREGITSTIYDYKNLVRQPSVGQVLKVVQRHSEIPQDTRSKIVGLMRKDYFLDEIVELGEVPYEGYVYDIVMEGAPNFVADGIIVHNCIDEFEKMKPEDRTALHEMMEQQSYHPMTEIMFLNGEKRRIGEVVEAAFLSDPESVIQGKDCQLLSLDRGLGLHSVGPDYRLTEAWVDRVSRHKAPDYFFRISYSNGRDVIVTPEHPVFVFRRGEIMTVPASDIREGDFVPAPALVPPSNQEMELNEVATAGNAKPVMQQTLLTPSLGRVLGYLITEGNFYRGRTTGIDFANYEQWILEDMNAHAQPLFGITPIPGIVGGKRVVLRYVSKVLYDYFRSNFPEMVRYSKEKRVPKQILAAGGETIREFLAAAFLGDGGVETEAMCYRTACRGLAEDYQDLLLRLGISSRIATDRSNDSYKVYITGDSMPRFSKLVVEKNDSRYEKIERLVRRGTKNVRHHETFPTGVAGTIVELYSDLGLRYDGRYWRNLREGSGITRDTLNMELATLEGRAIDLKRTTSDASLSVSDLRRRCGWSQADLARMAGLPRGKLDYLERGGYGEQERKRLQSLFRSAASDHLRSVRAEITKLRRLQELRFLRVRKTERLANEGAWHTDWVYDITVEPAHNFVANGLVLHNTVTIAKAGIYATLNARTAILAACNPVLGRYNPFQNLTENIGTLPIPLLTRFDLIFVFRDQPTPAEDEKLATHILAVHSKKTYTSPPPIEFSLLKKYLSYAKKISPNLSKEAVDRLKEYYLELRRATGTEDTIPPTPRTLEAMIRVATARARILLREEVTEEDALSAIALMNRMVEDVLTDATTKKTDFGIQLGKPAGETKNLRAAMEIFKGLEGTERKPVERKTFKEELVKARFSDEDAEKMIRTMFREGLVYESKPGFIRRLGG